MYFSCQSTLSSSSNQTTCWSPINPDRLLTFGTRHKRIVARAEAKAPFVLEALKSDFLPMTEADVLTLEAYLPLSETTRSANVASGTGSEGITINWNHPGGIGLNVS